MYGHSPRSETAARRQRGTCRIYKRAHVLPRRSCRSEYLRHRFLPELPRIVRYMFDEQNGCTTYLLYFSPVRRVRLTGRKVLCIRARTSARRDTCPYHLSEKNIFNPLGGARLLPVVYKDVGVRSRVYCVPIFTARLKCSSFSRSSRTYTSSAREQALSAYIHKHICRARQPQISSLGAPRRSLRKMTKVMSY